MITSNLIDHVWFIKEAIQKTFKKSIKKVHYSIMESSLRNSMCPDCGGVEFYEGPSGGLCTNYECSNPKCGSRFNIAPGFHYERISKPMPNKDVH